MREKEEKEVKNCHPLLRISIQGERELKLIKGGDEGAPGERAHAGSFIGCSDPARTPVTSASSQQTLFSFPTISPTGSTSSESANKATGGEGLVWTISAPLPSLSWCANLINHISGDGPSRSIIGPFNRSRQGVTPNLVF